MSKTTPTQTCLSLADQLGLIEGKLSQLNRLNPEQAIKIRDHIATLLEGQFKEINATIKENTPEKPEESHRIQVFNRAAERLKLMNPELELTRDLERKSSTYFRIEKGGELIASVGIDMYADEAEIDQELYRVLNTKN